MPTPRSSIVDFDSPGTYHCISRCVRRAFLCGDEVSNRQDWVHERLIFLAGVFAIDVDGFNVLENHVHNVLSPDPERVREWDDLQVAQRWSRLFPASIQRWALPLAQRDPKLASQIDDSGQVPLKVAVRIVSGIGSIMATLRERLSSLSWFMRCLKHHIAVMANREDGCTGHFWEGRFKSIRVLDKKALLQTMVYVDLNPIRAGTATTPESSDHTSVQDRIHVKHYCDKARGRRKTAPARAARLLRQGRGRGARSADQAGWLVPIHKLFAMTLDQYVATVDLAGRAIRSGSGAIPADLAPILERLAPSDDDFTAATSSRGSPLRLRGSVAGSPASCAAEAARRGVRYVLSTFT